MYSQVQRHEGKLATRAAGAGAAAVTLPTRKFVPNNERYLLPRRNLVRRASDASVVLVTGGPGYGKTALLQQIARSGEGPYAWLSLDPADHSNERFLAGLFAALAHAGLAAAAVDASLGEGSVHEQCDSILAYLAACPGTLRLVLDDFQHATADDEIIDIVEYLLRYLPANVQVIIGSRTRPWITALERLASRGALCEFTWADLRFTREETRRLVSETSGTALPDADLDVINTSLEGWPIALHIWHQVIAARVESTIDSRAAIARVYQRLGNFIQTEIFARQSPPVQTFLLESSVLPTLDEQACDAILGRNDSGLLIDCLERDNLLIVSDDDGSRRYHRVFHGFLRERFARHGRRRRELALAACSHFDARADHATSIDRLLDIGEWSTAANRLQQLADGAAELKSSERFGEWLKKIPSTVLDLHPRLLITWAERLDSQGEAGEARQIFLRAARLAGIDVRQQLIALASSARGLATVGSHLTGGRTGALIALYESVLASLKPDALERPIVLGLLAFARLAEGRLAASSDALDTALAEASRVGGSRGIELQVLLHGAFPVYFFRGSFAAALGASERARFLAQDLAHPSERCLANLQAAEVLLQLGRWSEARPYIEEALGIARRYHYRLLQIDAHRLLGDAQLSERPERDGGALGHYQAGFSLLRPGQTTDRLVETRLTLALANYHRRVGQRMEAIRQAQLAHDNVFSPHTVEEILIEPRALVALGAALIDVDPSGARELLQRAGQLAERYGDSATLAQATLWIATQAMRDGTGSFAASLDAALHTDHALLAEPDLGALLLVEAVLQKQGVEELSRLLVRGGRSTVPALVPLIDHPEVAVRRQVIHLLGKIGDVRVRRQLLRAYKDPDPEIRSTARATLDVLGQPDPPLLRIQFLGRFEVLRDGVAVSDAEWKTRKVKSLFKYLVLHPGQFVSQERLMDLLWPDANPSAASMNLRTTITSLRRALEPYLEGKASHFIIHQGEGIQFNTTAAYVVDVKEFDDHYRAGNAAFEKRQWDLALAHFRKADRLYQGDFLEEDLYEDWTAAEREGYREMHADLLLRMADINARQENFVEAVGLCQRVLTHDGCREDVHRRLMAYYAQAGRPVQAIRQYQICSRLLRKEFGVDPSSQTNDLFERIRAEMRGDGKRSP